MIPAAQMLNFLSWEGPNPLLIKRDRDGKRNGEREREREREIDYQF